MPTMTRLPQTEGQKEIEVEKTEINNNVFKNETLKENDIKYALLNFPNIIIELNEGEIKITPTENIYTTRFGYEVNYYDKFKNLEYSFSIANESSRQNAYDKLIGELKERHIIQTPEQKIEQITEEIEEVTEPQTRTVECFKYLDELIEQTPEHEIKAGKKIKDITKNENYEILSFDAGNITLKHLPRFSSSPKHDITIDWTEFLKNVKAGELKVDGYSIEEYKDLYFMIKQLVMCHSLDKLDNEKGLSKSEISKLNKDLKSLQKQIADIETEKVNYKQELQKKEAELSEIKQREQERFEAEQLEMERLRQIDLENERIAYEKNALLNLLRDIDVDLQLIELE